MPMTEERHMIWSNYDLDIEDFRDQIEEAYPDYSEEEKLQVMYEINNDFLDDDRRNLNIVLKHPILVIGDLGLWNGRHLGYMEIESGNIRDCLFSDNDYSTWYVDSEGEFRCDDVHHDGTNHYRYRVYRDGVDEADRDYLKGKIYDGTVTEDDIAQFTKRLGDEIGKVYGWKFPKEPERMTDTNIGRMPLEDYREIKASQSGFESYEELYNAGYRIGHGIDEPPVKQRARDHER